MLPVLFMILGLASVVLALLVMLQVIPWQDLLSFTSRGLVTLVVLLVAGCFMKQLVMTIVMPVLLPIAKISLIWSVGAVLAIVVLFVVIRLLMVATNSRHNA